MLKTKQDVTQRGKGPGSRRKREQTRVGRELRALRRQHKLTQQQLADLLAVAFRTVQRWELGEVRPSPLARARIAEVLENFSQDSARKG
jgi:DNA-binding transcriptional regulator YiaG